MIQMNRHKIIHLIRRAAIRHRRENGKGEYTDLHGHSIQSYFGRDAGKEHRQEKRIHDEILEHPASSPIR